MHWSLWADLFGTKVKFDISACLFSDVFFLKLSYLESFHFSKFSHLQDLPSTDDRQPTKEHFYFASIFASRSILLYFLGASLSSVELKALQNWSKCTWLAAAMGNSDGSKWDTRDMQPFSVQILSFLCSFRQNCSKIIGWCIPLRSWRPLPGKFWIRHWITFCKATEMLCLLISQSTYKNLPM